jgi:class 3 adenylate cyclase/CheY-like chemotaxis protein
MRPCPSSYLPNLSLRSTLSHVMPRKVLIVQADLKSAQALADLFAERGDQVWHGANAREAQVLLKQHTPDWVGIDLHLPDEDWQALWQQVRERQPPSNAFFTTNYPDPPRELRAAERGAQFFLRQPFTRAGLEQLAHSIEMNHRPAGAEFPPAQLAQLPKVRVPMRIKLTFPYALLALLLAIAAAYLVSRVTVDSLENRFTDQLIETGKLTSDGMVQEENRLLENLRLLSHSKGMAEMVVAGDAEQLRRLALSLAINSQEEAIEVLDAEGKSLVSLHHRPGGNLEDYDVSRGAEVFTQWNFVQNVLQRRELDGGDKYAGLGHTDWGDYFYVAGPLQDSAGQLVGVILVGKSLPTLARQLRQDTLAHVTFYDLSGQPLASTLSLQDSSLALNSAETADILNRQAADSLIRDVKVASINYAEILGPSEARNGEDLGLTGVALARTFLVHTSVITRLQVFLLVAMALVLVIIVGVYLANRITQPLLRVVGASAEVAQGNLEVNVEPVGNDEVAILAHSFNHMVSRLREGSIYRDLLGRTVSPEVREQLRQTFAAGDLRLEGQTMVATVLISDIRGFTTLSEKAPPATVLVWLNEYFSEMVPLITAEGGVVNTFQGDALLAFFGILPQPLSPQESAYRACRAAEAMLKVIEQINTRRFERKEPPLITGIGLNTGPVTAGGLGSADRLNYTIIGDTVNTTQRLEELTRQFGESGVVVSQTTFAALEKHQAEFKLESLGAQSFRGKAEPLTVYRLKSMAREP